MFRYGNIVLLTARFLDVVVNRATDSKRLVRLLMFTYYFSYFETQRIGRVMQFKRVNHWEGLGADGRIIYRVIHKSLRDIRTRLRNNQDRHGRKEDING